MLDVLIAGAGPAGAIAGIVLARAGARVLILDRARFPREKLQYGIDRYVNESNRLYGVLEKRLAGREWVAADELTIADIAIFPWLRFPENQGVEIDKYPNVKRWRDKIAARPKVVKALETLKDHRRSGPGYSDKAWELLYGKTQATQGKSAAE